MPDEYGLQTPEEWAAAYRGIALNDPPQNLLNIEIATYRRQRALAEAARQAQPQTGRLGVPTSNFVVQNESGETSWTFSYSPPNSTQTFGSAESEPDLSNPFTVPTKPATKKKKSSEAPDVVRCRACREYYPKENIVFLGSTTLFPYCTEDFRAIAQCRYCKETMLPTDWNDETSRFACSQCGLEKTKSRLRIPQKKNFVSQTKILGMRKEKVWDRSA